MITDSQKGKKEQLGYANGKSVGKKPKSKRKGDVRGREGLSSPVMHKKSPLSTDLQKPHVPMSRSKSRGKKKSKSKGPSSSEFEKKAEQTIRSEVYYGSSKASSGMLSRTNKTDSLKRSMRSNEKRLEGKRSDIGGQEMRYIKHGKSPNNVPRPVK